MLVFRRPSSVKGPAEASMFMWWSVVFLVGPCFGIGLTYLDQKVSKTMALWALLKGSWAITLHLGSR